MNDEFEKMNLHSPDWANENIRKLAEIFPNCVTETQGADGTIKRAIDYDQLRQELSDHIVDGTQERYHLNWPGKREALMAANAPIAKTLRPVRDESVKFDTTKNLFIEGDNLEALKLLQETYLGKVKMIMATNRPDVLDPALLRPGRLDRKIEIPLPNEASRVDVLKIHAAPITKQGEIDYDSVTKLADAFNAADLRNVCTEAGMFAIRAERDYVVSEDFMKAVRKVAENKKLEGKLEYSKV